MGKDWSVGRLGPTTTTTTDWAADDAGDWGNAEPKVYAIVAGRYFVYGWCQLSFSPSPSLPPSIPLSLPPSLFSGYYWELVDVDGWTPLDEFNVYKIKNSSHKLFW